MPLCFAQTFTAVADAYVAVGNKAKFGNLPTLRVGVGGLFRALVQFDLSALPCGAIDVDAAIGEWGESTVDGVDAPALGDPDTRTAFVFRPGAYVEIDATDMVCAWLNGTPNRGFLLAGNPAHAATSVRFDSREADHPAVLRIHLAGGPSPLLSLAAN